MIEQRLANKRFHFTACHQKINFIPLSTRIATYDCEALDYRILRYHRPIGRARRLPPYERDRRLTLRSFVYQSAGVERRCALYHPGEGRRP
jgi:hypothetical protein